MLTFFNQEVHQVNRDIHKYLKQYLRMNYVLLRVNLCLGLIKSTLFIYFLVIIIR
jgi:hypothetical protein